MVSRKNAQIIVTVSLLENFLKYREIFSQVFVKKNELARPISCFAADLKKLKNNNLEIIIISVLTVSP